MKQDIHLRHGLWQGETAEWLARTLGHVDTSMVYRTYGRYIPNLTARAAKPWKTVFLMNQTKKGNQKKDTTGHNFGHNGLFKSCLYGLTWRFC